MCAGRGEEEGGRGDRARGRYAEEGRQEGRGDRARGEVRARGEAGAIETRSEAGREGRQSQGERRSWLGGARERGREQMAVCSGREVSAILQQQGRTLTTVLQQQQRFDNHP